MFADLHVDRVQHLVLPSLTLILARSRSSAATSAARCSTCSAPTTCARRGPRACTRNVALRRHALRTALIPSATFFAFNFGLLFVGVDLHREDLRLARHGRAVRRLDRPAATSTRWRPCRLLRRDPRADRRAAVRHRLRRCSTRGDARRLDARAAHRPRALPRRSRSRCSASACWCCCSCWPSSGRCLSAVGLRPDHDFTAFLEPPSSSHWFGTTQTGGDVYALTLRGMQKSLVIGCSSRCSRPGSRRSSARSPATSAAGSTAR